MAGIEHSMQNIREQIIVWRRRIIAGVILLVLGIVVIDHLVAALRISLERSLGPVSGRLTLAIILALVMGLVAAQVWYAERRKQKADPAKDRVSSIVDAISLGYSLAQDFKSAVGFGGKAASKPNSADEKLAKKERARAQRSSNERAPVDPAL